MHPPIDTPDSRLSRSTRPTVETQRPPTVLRVRCILQSTRRIRVFHVQRVLQSRRSVPLDRIRFRRGIPNRFLEDFAIRIQLGCLLFCFIFFCFFLPILMVHAHTPTHPHTHTGEIAFIDRRRRVPQHPASRRHHGPRPSTSVTEFSFFSLAKL